MKCDIGLINVIVIYWYCRNDKIPLCLTELTALLEKIADHPSIILGDFNFDTLKCDNVTFVETYVNALIS